MPESKVVAQDTSLNTQLKILENHAIQAALSTDWEKAIDLNKQILKIDDSNVESHNRLGRAYSESGQVDKARASYRSVLRFDPYNSIALKNLERLKAISGSGVKITGSGAFSPDLFMEEPGKTKVLEASDLTRPEILAQLHTADAVLLEPSEKGILIRDAAGRKLGLYQGELAEKLNTLLKGGNVYQAYVKSVKPSELKIFVHEIKRTPKFANTPSFPTVDNGFKPYVHESAVEVPTPDVDLDPSDTTASEAAAAKKIASVESLAEQETDQSHVNIDEEEN
jgi:hypothetical protein